MGDTTVKRGTPDIVNKVIDESKDCGGEDLSVLIQGTNWKCETGNHDSFAKGETLEWKNCISKTKLDLHEDELQFILKTNSRNKFCACQLEVAFEFGIIYKSKCLSNFHESTEGKTYNASRMNSVDGISTKSSDAIYIARTDKPAQMKVVIDEDKACGGDDLQIVVHQGQEICTSKKRENFQKGDTQIWTQTDLTCTGNNTNQDGTVQWELNNMFVEFHMNTTSYNSYCPLFFKATFEHEPDSKSNSVIDYEKTFPGKSRMAYGNNNDNHNARRKQGEPKISAWDVSQKAADLPEFQYEYPDDNEFNAAVIEKYKLALESTFPALDSYFNQDNLINIDLLNDYENSDDDKAISKVIRLLNETKTEIQRKVNDFGADYKLGEATKDILNNLLVICKEIKKKKESDDNNVGSLQTKYEQRKREMELLRDKKYVEIQDEKNLSYHKLLSAFSDVEKIIDLEMKPSIDNSDSNTSDWEEIKGKLKIQKNITKEVHYVYDNEKTADLILEVIESLEKLMKIEAEKTNKIKFELDAIKNKLSDFNIAMKIIDTSGSFTKRPPPKRYARSGEKVYSAYGSNAKAIVTAKIKLDQTKWALEEAKREAKQANKQKDFYEKRIDEKILELLSLKNTILTQNETLSVLEKGLECFGKLKKEWQKLLLFFDEMATNIKSAMGEEMTNLCLKAKGLSNIETKERMSWGKSYFYDTIFQSSTLAYIVQKQAGLYHEVSTEKIMPPINKLGVLLTLTDEEKINEEYDNLANIVNKSRTDIKALVNIARNEFYTSLSLRITNLDQLWSKLTEKVPEALAPEIQEGADEVNCQVCELKKIKPESCYGEPCNVEEEEDEDYDYVYHTT